MLEMCLNTQEEGTWDLQGNGKVPHPSNDLKHASQNWLLIIRGLLSQHSCTNSSNTFNPAECLALW